jgi:hypothetical protein
MDESTTQNLIGLSVPIYGTLVLWGLLDCFFGYKIFRFTVSLLVAFAGGLLGAFLGFIWGDGSMVWALSGFVCGSLLGGLLAFSFVVLGAVMFGALLGWTYLQPLSLYVGEEWQMLFLIVGTVLTGAIAAVILEPMIRITTSFTGAFRVVFGLFFFANGPDFLNLSDGQLADFRVLKDYPLAFVLSTLLGSIGLFYQWPKRHADSDKHYKKK